VWVGRSAVGVPRAVITTETTVHTEGER
jgi:hypothetical protein